MEKIFTLLTGMVLSILILKAQNAPPQAFSYKATITNAKGGIIANKTIGLQISILQGSSIGVPVYTETFRPTTNAYGQIDIVIGRGLTGDLSSINWSADKYFLKTEVDDKGGTNYKLLSIVELLSVPYSLYAGESGNGFASIYTDTEKRPIINDKGNIGLGVPADEYWKLRVDGPSLISNYLQVWGGLGMANALWITPGTTTWGSWLVLDATQLAGGEKFGIFSIGGDASEGQGKFLIKGLNPGQSFTMDKDGNIGLDNYSPAYKLDVSGDINFTGGFYKNGIPFSVDYTTLTNKPTGNNIGDMQYWNGTNWAVVPVGSEDQILTIKRGIPTWSTIATGNQLPTITDADGNVYQTVQIGAQIWMAENLKTSKYRNGDAIPIELNNSDWSSATSGACAIYDNNNANNTSYGKLYNWFAVADNRNLCPTGWHVPSNDEWTLLITFLGGEPIAASKMKETGISHWASPNSDANNSSGFTALPGGLRHSATGIFYQIYNIGHWWSTTEVNSSTAWYLDVNYSNSNVYRNNVEKTYGFSVRCLKDN